MDRMSMNGHKGRLDRLADTIRARGQSEYDNVATRHLFAVELHQAAANYDNADPATVAERVADVERSIAAVDRIRRTHDTDVIGAAMAKHSHTPDLDYTPDAVAASVVEACFHHDAQEHGEPYAWAHQRKREHIAGIVRARMDGERDVAIIGTAEQRAWLGTLTVEELEIGSDVMEHIERTGSTEGLDPELVAQYNALMDRWNEWSTS